MLKAVQIMFVISGFSAYFGFLTYYEMHKVPSIMSVDEFNFLAVLGALFFTVSLLLLAMGLAFHVMNKIEPLLPGPGSGDDEQ